jgi:hypothetical protein
VCGIDWKSVIEGIKGWQDLIAGVIGAAVLSYTVYVTLSTERRRRDSESDAMRIALGAEVRQFAGRAINAHGAVCHRLKTARALVLADSSHALNITVLQMRGEARFPEPVVYPNSADRLGLLGPYAHDVVYFFAQVNVVMEALRLIGENTQPNTYLLRDQVVNLASALLNAAEAGIRAFPAFPSVRDPEKIREATVNARAAFDSGESTTPGEEA